jgi:hypothetical protein
VLVIVLYIDSDPIGRGNERDTYIHPDDPGKCIKICKKARSIQTEREVSYFKKLQRRKEFSWTHLPRFFETIPTNKGSGMVVEVVRDYDGQISKNLTHYLSTGLSINQFRAELNQLKAYLLQYSIIFNYDMSADNLLYQRVDENNGRLMVIDGLGDTVFISLLNFFKSHVTKKILRRWERFEKELYKHHTMSNGK